MTHTVEKSFRTPTHRLSVGQTVSEADLDGPLSLQDWVNLGYVKDDNTPMPSADASTAREIAPDAGVTEQQQEPAAEAAHPAVAAAEHGAAE